MNALAEKTVSIERKMPNRLNLGRQYTSVMAAPMMRLRERQERPAEYNPLGLRTVMGFCLPTWQRPLVWTEAQMVAFIESAWLGINLGTYTYNQVVGSKYDGFLVDGQQRMYALERYLADAFPVFGYRWSEVSVVDRRIWEMSTIFASYVTETEDEEYLRNYYNLTNFGGTPHEPHQRA
jgi:hypothetical protein